MLYVCFFFSSFILFEIMLKDIALAIKKIHKLKGFSYYLYNIQYLRRVVTSLRIAAPFPPQMWRSFVLLWEAGRIGK